MKLLLKPWLALAIWTTLVLGSLGWNLHQAQAARAELALKTARSFFDQVVLTRRWNARHGGVYVRVTEDTQPNPYLKIPKRDIRVSDDLMLTAVNPAYMTRQLAELADQTNGVQFHITSLDPIRPENRPETWERLALQRFEQGEAETGEFFSNGDHEAYRYMAPLITEEPCLNCHAEQGYKVDDVRGGISVMLPDVAALPWLSLTVSHLLIGLVGGGLILLSTRLLQQAHDRLRQQAVFDTLTSIPNRRYFVENLVEEFRRGRRQRLPLSLIICDIDNFKSYNDNFGHPAGDRCLRAVAQALQDGLKRGGDFCARYGGEEFVVVLPDTPLPNAVKVAEDMREAIAGLGMRHPGASDGIVTISMGVATDDPRNPDHEALIRQADEALYRAKELGRNRVEAHHPEQSAGMSDLGEESGKGLGADSGEELGTGLGERPVGAKS
ncbi:sensor domain-containing diguanylate cyclase [Thiorhodovibrio frisius]|uniref:diguanylate cyclase n=1 Tax=Thiorhodovibrio frisius TaxID=631362 RepID=H8Z586_9GAMM|nr:diguanylate cyclase [Thiorhodovibrio frisius]EIC20493.1 diguanylate cyclase (GGDEF) domain-containing protein [Thiorhodovibrio frisius]WPL21234.1 Bacteriophytochrome cph2 [Thiorhodovibrio frisius]